MEGSITKFILKLNLKQTGQSKNNAPLRMNLNNLMLIIEHHITRNNPFSYLKIRLIVVTLSIILSPEFRSDKVSLLTNRKIELCVFQLKQVSQVE